MCVSLQNYNILFFAFYEIWFQTCALYKWIIENDWQNDNNNMEQKKNIKFIRLRMKCRLYRLQHTVTKIMYKFVCWSIYQSCFYWVTWLETAKYMILLDTCYHWANICWSILIYCFPLIKLYYHEPMLIKTHTYSIFVFKTWIWRRYKVSLGSWYELGVNLD